MNSFKQDFQKARYSFDEKTDKILRVYKNQPNEKGPSNC